ncbi:MAG: hypothetical protein F4X83_04935 [Chloroflexi bacterium]|nr:hypothetical protein [Chloroflexota bacterium]
MQVNGEFIVTIATIILVGIGLMWRFETRISGVETRLSERVSRLEGLIEGLTARVSRIESVLDSYFVQAGKKEAE